MQNFYINFFKSNYFKFYLISIFFFSILFLSQKFLHPTDWTTSEWLINYQGGFVRRGLVGQFIFELHQITDISLRYLIFYFEIFILILFLILIYKFFQDIKLNGLLIFLFFSPIFLIYSVAENEALIRKEFILFCIYIVYLNLILNDNKFSFLVILVFLPIMNLIWDGAIFYVYFFFFSFLCKKNIQIRDIILNIFSYIPYLISLYFVITTKSDPNNFEQMCLSINESCFGAMFALDKTLLWNIDYVYSRFKAEYLVRHLFIIILCFSPIFIFSYFDKFNIKIGNILIKKFLLKINVILFFSILLFMIVGYDWGRWINIGYSFSILTFIFLIKNQNVQLESNNLYIVIENFLKLYPRLFYVLFIFYIFTWNMKIIMTDDIGSLPYYRILIKSAKIISTFF